MSRPTPIAEILRRIRPLAPRHKQFHLNAVIASEKGDNPRRTSVRIRELEAAIKQVVNNDLGVPRKPRKNRRVIAA